MCCVRCCAMHLGYTHVRRVCVVPLAIGARARRRHGTIVKTVRRARVRRMKRTNKNNMCARVCVCMCTCVIDRTRHARVCEPRTRRSGQQWRRLRQRRGLHSNERERAISFMKNAELNVWMDAGRNARVERVRSVRVMHARARMFCAMHTRAAAVRWTSWGRGRWCGCALAQVMAR